MATKKKKVVVRRPPVRHVVDDDDDELEEQEAVMADKAETTTHKAKASPTEDALRALVELCEAHGMRDDPVVIAARATFPESKEAAQAEEKAAAERAAANEAAAAKAEKEHAAKG